MAGNEHTAGVSIGLDASEFLGGSAKAQDEIERLVASFIHASREGDKTVAALEKSLSATPKEVTKALREMDKQDAEAGRIVARRQASAQKAARDRHRIEMRMLKERGQAVSNLRDSLLSLAAISIGGGAGLAGAYNAVKGVAQEGANEVSFARRTGTDARQNMGEEFGADRSSISNAGEVRASIANWRKELTSLETNGKVSDSFRRLLTESGVQDTDMRTMKHDDFVQAVIKGYRRLHWNDRQIASRLEASGLTSGGYTAFALDGDKFRKDNKDGAEAAKRIDPQQEFKVAQSFARLENDVNLFRRLVTDDMDPVIDGMDRMVSKLYAASQKHPGAVQAAAGLAAGVTGIGAIAALLAPIAAIVGSIKMASTIKNLQAELASLREGGGAASEGATSAAGAGAEAAETAGAGLGMTVLRAGLRVAGPVGAAYGLLAPSHLGGGDTFDLSKRSTGLPDGQHVDMERLLDAVEMTESGGGKKLLSPAGARGPFQFMPATAKELGINPDDPVQAREGARRYLLALEKHYNNDTDKALAAYNGGQGHLDKIIARYGTDWRAHLTSAENANYGGRVASFYRTRQYVRSPGAAAATPRPVMASAPTAHPAGPAPIVIQNQTVRANNAEEFRQSMRRTASNAGNVAKQWNSGQG